SSSSAQVSGSMATACSRSPRCCGRRRDHGALQGGRDPDARRRRRRCVRHWSANYITIEQGRLIGHNAVF
ncbi:MAG: hypothetical protein ACO3GW_07160, partial [Vulcanococcus sp.]